MNVTVTSTGFNAMIKDLARISGRTFSGVLKHEAARVIEKAVAFTPSAKPPKRAAIQAMAEKAASRVVSASNPGIVLTKSRNGKVWLREKDNSLVDPRYPRQTSTPALHRMDDPNRHWNKRRWQTFRELEQQRQLEIKAAKLTIAAQIKAVAGARGLSKKSWWEAGYDLRLPMRGIPAYVTNAKPSNGRSYKNGIGSEHGGASNSDLFFLVIENRYPALVGGRVRKTSKKGKSTYLNGHAILQRAINTRLSAFKMELKKGVFDNLKLRASRHPGVFVT